MLIDHVSKSSDESSKLEVWRVVKFEVSYLSPSPIFPYHPISSKLEGNEMLWMKGDQITMWESTMLEQGLKHQLMNQKLLVI